MNLQNIIVITQYSTGFTEYVACCMSIKKCGTVLPKFNCPTKKPVRTDLCCLTVDVKFQLNQVYVAVAKMMYREGAMKVKKQGWDDSIKQFSI